jgi:CP family cyanate transporter-like MFS transporter
VNRQRITFLVGLFAASLALRVQLVGVGPLLPRIHSDLDVSHAVGGLLVTIPVLFTGLIAPPAPFFARNLGPRFAISAGLGATAVFGLARALAPGTVGVLLLTIPIGVGVGLTQALLPVAVKERAADGPTFATGVYVTGFSVGSATATALAVPAADSFHGWRGAFSAFSVVASLLVVAWLALTRAQAPHVRSRTPRARLPLRNKLAWWLLGIFALNGSIFYGLASWLPASYVERGWSQSSSALLLTVLILGSLPVGLLVPWVADRIGSRRVYLASSAAVMTGALVGFVLAPGGAWLWAALAGAANVVAFVLTLTLPLDVTDRPDEVAAMTGMMLGGGYVCSAIAPFGLGAVRDLTGNFHATLWVIAAACGALLVLTLPLSPRRLHRGLTGRVALGAVESAEDEAPVPASAGELLP